MCSHYGIDENELYLVLKKKENKYMLLLLMREFKCFYKERLKDELNYKNDKSIKNNLKKAEEKLLINKDFRDHYFYLEEKIQDKF